VASICHHLPAECRFWAVPSAPAAQQHVIGLHHSHMLQPQHMAATVQRPQPTDNPPCFSEPCSNSVIACCRMYCCCYQPCNTPSRVSHVWSAGANDQVLGLLQGMDDLVTNRADLVGQDHPLSAASPALHHGLCVTLSHIIWHHCSPTTSREELQPSCFRPTNTVSAEPAVDQPPPEHTSECPGQPHCADVQMLNPLAQQMNPWR
jgi:hypothetical protein